MNLNETENTTTFPTYILDCVKDVRMRNIINIGRKWDGKGGEVILLAIMELVDHYLSPIFDMHSIKLSLKLATFSF